MNEEIKQIADGMGRTFTVSHRQAEDKSTYSMPSSGVVPNFALRRATEPKDPSVSHSVCPVNHGQQNSSGSAAEGGGEAPRCPLGFGNPDRNKKAESVSKLPTMSLLSLSRHDGQIPRMPTFISIKGLILDVSGDKTGTFQPPNPMAGCRGHDCSRMLAKGSVDLSLLDQRLAGLEFDDHKRLEAYAAALSAKFPTVARLNVQDFDALFGSNALGSSSSGASSPDDAEARTAAALTTTTTTTTTTAPPTPPPDSSLSSPPIANHGYKESSAVVVSSNATSPAAATTTTSNATSVSATIGRLKKASVEWRASERVSALHRLLAAGDAQGVAEEIDKANDADQREGQTESGHTAQQQQQQQQRQQEVAGEEGAAGSSSSSTGGSCGRGGALHTVESAAAATAATAAVTVAVVGPKCKWLANSACARTGLRPLHKALEASRAFAAPDTTTATTEALPSSSSSLVRVLVRLLVSGADPTARAGLYDEEDPAALAARFGVASEWEAARKRTFELG